MKLELVGARASQGPLSSDLLSTPVSCTFFHENKFPSEESTLAMSLLLADGFQWVCFGLDRK